MSRLKIQFGQALLGCLAVFLAVDPGPAAKPKTTYPVARVRVRVGDHPGYTRVVFDSPARLHYKIVRRSARLLAVVFEGAVLARPLVTGGLGRRKLVRAVIGRSQTEQPTVLIRLARPFRKKVSCLVNPSGTPPSRRHQLVVDLYPRAAAVKTKTKPMAKKSPGPSRAGRGRAKPTRAGPT
ncbi:MAG: hypothetical protein KKC37_15245, partial [Proteobacteria bacterium]|nr:hypothetical protein [Pseudomonadota bacterium]